MWIKKEGENTEGGRCMWKYILNENYICEVFAKETVRDDQVNPQHWYDGVHKGYVFNVGTPDEIRDSGWFYEHILYDKDLDVLKLKCLIKAKEVGWSIGQII